MLVAANLRPAISAVGPLLGDVRISTGMSAATAGLLTSLPLLMFAATSQLAVFLGRLLSSETALLTAMVALSVGSVVRSLGSTGAALLGTTVIGSAIAIGNVLLPTYLKERIDRSTGPVMGVYAATLQASSGIAAGLSVPLDSAGLGWQGSLGVWAILAIVAAFVWRGYIARAPRTVRRAVAAGAVPRISQLRLAWSVSAFFGFQAMIFYGLVTWLPTLLGDSGMSAAGGGLALAVMQISSLPASLAIPVLAARRTDQRRFVLAGAVVCGLGLAGLAVGGSAMHIAAAVLIGLGNGTLFSLGLTFLILRAADAPHVAALGGMAQTVGYLLGSASPVAIGWLRDATGGWSAPVLLLEVIVVAATLTGWAAARGQLGPVMSATS
ncbi:MAG: major facilitator superfamily 1 [Pseudonocardiales bacterium]|nr:major facilitator superfamily 1 [Pseudonocardiales bacterium]